jgi:threonine/homoserine/homoserine lactone efflux protein
MLEHLATWWQFNFWLSLASLAVGIAVVSPFLLSRGLRKKFMRSDLDLESIGLLTIVVVIIAIGCYNYFGAGSGA